MLIKLKKIMTKNQSLIVSDFDNDYLINYLRSNKELKKNFGSLNFENFLSSINELNQEEMRYFYNYTNKQS